MYKKTDYCTSLFVYCIFYTYGFFSEINIIYVLIIVFTYLLMWYAIRGQFNSRLVHSPANKNITLKKR